MEKPVLKIVMTDGLTAFIEITDKERSGMELFKHIVELTEGMNIGKIGCDATVPMISVDQQTDINWLVGMRATNAKLIISQALQQNKLTIDLDGIHTQSAVAIGTRKCVMLDREHFTVDKPFNVWLEYGNPDNKHFPLFCAYVATDSWKKPNK